MTRDHGIHVDHLVQRVLDSARTFVALTNLRIRSRDDLRAGACVLVISGHDATARAFYRDCHAAGMRGPPKLKSTMVTTFLQRYQDVLGVARNHYDFTSYEEPVLGSDEVRAVVLTRDTLTHVRLDADSNVTACSPLFPALKRNVLVLATAHWRNDRPEGFAVHFVPFTREPGDYLVSRCASLIARMDRTRPSRESLEDELRKWNLVKQAGRGVSGEERALLFARVAWLERQGLLTIDDKNGVQFFYGVESDLEDAEERARVLSDTLFPN